MQLEELDAKDLKIWVMKTLDDISDADSDVLADYVLALLRTEAKDGVLKANTILQLEDFLDQHTPGFVDELFKVIESRSYTTRPRHDVSAPPYASSNARSSQSATPQPSIPTQPRAMQGFPGVPTGPRYATAQSQSKKRPYQDPTDFHDDTLFGPPSHDERRINKRGRRDGSEAQHTSGVSGHDSKMHHFPPDQMQDLNDLMTGIQASDAAFSPFAMQNAAAAMLTLQAMGMQLPPFERIGSPTHGLQVTKRGIPCDDYNRKGFCTKGINCPFDHGSNQILIPQSQGSGSFAARSGSFPGQGNDRSQQKEHRGSHRSVFSRAGPNHDKRLTSIVVEQIPEENFDEQQVRRFFQSFGPIAEVDMQPYKRLAIIRYVSFDSARAAYDSPKVIFDNRFVKVFWLNSDSMQPGAATDGSLHQSGSFSTQSHIQDLHFSKEELDEKTALAQRKFEERNRLRNEIESKSQNLDQERLEVEKRLDEERDKLAAKLVEKGIDPELVVYQANKSMRAQQAASSLKAQIASLLAEARKLGIDPYDMDDGASQMYGGGYHGNRHGHLTYHSSNYKPHDSGFGGAKTLRSKGLGSDNSVPFRGAVRAGGRYNLDLRPRRVRIVVHDGKWTDEKDEALREHLISLGEYEAIETVPVDEDGDVIVAFKDRPTAESFFWGPRHLANIGNLTFSWVANPQITISDASRIDGDVDMANADTESYIDMRGIDADDRTFEDKSNDGYDVAEEDERWTVK